MRPTPRPPAGLIRDEILPLLRRLHPGAEANLRALGEERPRLPRALEASLVDLLASRAGSKAADLGGGVRAVREYGDLRLEGTVEWGPWTLESERDGLEVRARRPGDHLAGRRKKVQDLFVDAKVPRAERDAWPVVVCGGEVVAVPGIADAPGWAGVVTARRVARERDRPRGRRDPDRGARPSRSASRALGAEISADYAGRDLLLVGVLKGAVFFMADLMRELSIPCEIDFMAISSYGAATDSSGVVRILKDLDINIAGRDVLVVEDIIDSGLTLSYLMRNLQARKPASLEICALLTKPGRREIDVPVRYVGFEIPNKFVIGYGLDFAERYRNLPYVGVLHPDLIPGSRIRPIGEHGFRATAWPRDHAATLPVPVNRFFRSALFPLVVIVLLVYLASQTLIPKRDNEAKLTYSELITAGEARGTSTRSSSTRTASRSARRSTRGKKVKVNYPTAAVADPVPEHPRRRTTSSSTPRAPAPRRGSRSSPGCCRSCSSSASGSS